MFLIFEKPDNSLSHFYVASFRFIDKNIILRTLKLANLSLLYICYSAFDAH